ncbi:HK97 family phage portal protein [Rhizobium sp. PP-F2F-G48]|uniref:phage portal protein n=1 Tax=Rhizobium sp. PP-F2F-G48 TaxID=2135651 RepID=UPI00104740DF|nr:phage portal protein [Rhizobium sp. PP-F2F-G48]TCM57836.1 HK97 family phage portal protein [Rhizobium sp. PP-F2F-G48]
MLAGILSNAKKAFGLPVEQKAYPLTSPEVERIFGVGPTIGDIAVTAETAMEVPAVSCAVGIIAEKIGDLPAKLFAHGTKETNRDHPAYKLIHDEANGHTSAAKLRADLTMDALKHDKGGFAHVVRSDFDGRPLELNRLDPGAVQLWHEDDGEPFYIVQDRNKRLRIDYTDMLHIQALGGRSPITRGRNAIALAIAFERHVASLFANGGRPSGILSTEKSLTPEAKERIGSSWFSTHSGKKAGGIAILDEKMAFEQLTMSLTDAQFSENRVEQIREIARVFRVPATMLFELSRGTFANTEEMARQFYTITLKPWLTTWAWAYARVLLTPEERDRFYIEFVTDDLLTTDTAARATAYGQYRSMGVMTGNEVRAGLNLAPHPDGDSLSNPHITTTPAAPETSKEAE